MHSQATHQVTGQNSDPGAELEPIAVVGMAGRFPGVGAEEDLWSFMMDGGDAIRPVPGRAVGRVPAAGSGARGPGGRCFPGRRRPVRRRLLRRLAPRGGGPRPAATTGPGDQLAGPGGRRAAGRGSGRQPDRRLRRLLLARLRDAARRQGGALHPAQPGRQRAGRDRGPGLVHPQAARRPSLNVETGCSSSLVALHLAVQALRTGEVEAALVAGSNLILAPDVTVGLTHFGGLSPDGRCAASSAAANGFVRGEGVAVVYLKTLRRAVADGDRVHGVIVRTAVNNDNDGDSLVQPSQAGEEDLLRLAYGTGDGPGDIPADSVAYLEAHGTGTGKGDPIEATAVGRVLGARRAEPLPIGSAKTNLGHLAASARDGGAVQAAAQPAPRHRAAEPDGGRGQPGDPVRRAERARPAGAVAVARHAVPPGAELVRLGRHERARGAGRWAHPARGAAGAGSAGARPAAVRAGLRPGACVARRAGR